MKIHEGVISVIVALSLLLPALPAAAGEDDWIIRIGASKYHPKGKNGELVNPLAPGTDLELDVENGTAPTIDISRFLGDRWAIELMVQLPAKHLIKFEHGPIGTGNATIGEIRRTTAILNAQYHLAQDGWFRPYLGAGFLAAFYQDAEGRDFLEDARLHVENSLGFGVQVGIDAMLSERWLLNCSLRYLWNESHFKVNDEVLTTADLTGLLWGLHLGYRL